MLNKSLTALAIFLGYILLRFPLDFWWRSLGPYDSYIFEAFYVALVTGYYYKKLNFRLNLNESFLPDMVLPLLSGFAIYRLIEYSGLQIPFDFASSELFILLLVVAPVLEELIFRMALWESFSQLFRSRPTLTLLVTTFLFSLGHLMALCSVPQQLRAFVLVQTLYVILLGLAAGTRRIKTGKISAAILLHFCFNLGFYLAAKLH